MRIALIESQGTSYVALEHDDKYYPWDRVMPSPAPASVLELLEPLARGSLPEPVFDAAEPIAAPFTVQSPFIPPRNLICVGKNYAQHVQEFNAFSGDSRPEVEPVVFTKSPTSVVSPYGEVVVHSELATMLDYEVELAVVIGVGGHRIPAAEAASHVAGFSVVNDVTDRAAQNRNPQWFLAKSIRHGSGFGPVLVTPDEVADDARLTTHVDGELRQDTRLNQMIFGIPEIIEYVSSYLELQPGDVIATGTPSGVGIGFTPPRCIADGATVRCAIEGVGVIENRFRFVGGVLGTADLGLAVAAGSDAAVPTAADVAQII